MNIENHEMHEKRIRCLTAESTEYTEKHCCKIR